MVPNENDEIVYAEIKRKVDSSETPPVDTSTKEATTKETASYENEEESTINPESHKTIP